MRILRLSSHSDNRGVEQDLSWEELGQLLTSHKLTPCHPCPGKSCVFKNGPAWVPAVFGDKLNSKGGRRHKKNVNTLTAGVLDFDHLTPEALESLIQLLEPFQCIVHTSHSHSPEDVCVRVVLKLSREVQFSEWSTFYPKLVKAFGSQADEACKNGDRIYYLPSCSSDSEHWGLISEGTEVLDVDALLSFEEAPEPETEVLPPLDLSDVRSKLRAEIRVLNKAGHTDKALLLKRVIDAEPIALEGSRDTTINKVASQLAWTLPINVSPEVCVQLLFYSIQAMPHQEEGLEYWLEKVKDCFIRAQERRLEHEREQERARQLVLNSMSKAPSDEWQAGLALTKDGRISGIGPNLGLIFQEAEQFQNAFRFNEVTKDIDLQFGMFKDAPKQTLHIAVSNWLYKELGIQTEPQTVKEQIAHNARLNSYDPLKEYLMALEWDGVKRLETFFVSYCHSPEVLEDGTSALPYYSKIGPKWFIGAVARALDPGQLVKSILVLEGKQNAKKSALLRALAGAGYFSDSVVNIASKESTMLISRMWFVELAELAFMKGASSNDIKNFISRVEDYIRPPYGAVLEAFLRRAILIGTTNDEVYLEDHTGNVRYWPVKVGLIDVDRVLEDRAQLWAEAVHLYLQGEQWWLAPEDVQMVEVQTSQRLPDDPLDEIISKWLLNFEPAKRPASLTALEVSLQVLTLSKEKIDKRTQERVGLSLQRLGFTKTRASKGYKYTASEELMSAPRVATMGGFNG